MLSVLILTKNEERNLSRCLEAVSWCDDIVVFDSESTDRTREIAEQHGVRVKVRPFDNYAAQRNAAMTEVDYKHPWLLMVDADERCGPAVADEMRQAISDPENSGVTLFHLRRKDMFLGRWLRRSSGYPTWFGRLMKLGHVTVEREINEEYHTKGEKGYLRGHLTHYPFSKGVAYWFERHNRYSTMEAQAIVDSDEGWPRVVAFFSRDPAVRRKATKALAYRIPLRPVLMFFALYVVRLGFLDRLPGLYYCAMRAAYELMIDVKVRELRWKESGGD